jgi:hypothetical protein
MIQAVLEQQELLGRLVQVEAALVSEEVLHTVHTMGLCAC